MEGQMSFFDIAPEEDKGNFQVSFPDVGEFDKETLLAFEKETLGIYVSGHPMEAYQELWQKNVTARTSDFIVDEDGHTVVEDNSIVVVGGMITAKKVKTTRTSQLMAFVSLEDMVGTVEALVFPKIYEKNKQYLTEDSKVFLRGRASIGDDPVGKLVCEEVIPFSAIPNELWLQFEDQEFYERTVDSVMAVLRESEGKDRVVMYLKKDDPKILTLYAASAGFLLAVILLYRILYPKVSKLIVNNMCMLLCIGMIMLTRLEEENAIKQLIFAAVGVVIGLVVPVVIRKLDRLKDWGYMYAGAGILALVLVAVLAEVSGGAKLGFTIAGFGIQPSEFVKILFVFFVAANLNRSLEFKNIVITTALAAAHVLILVLSTDLGTALILFVVYLVMLYTATRQPLYVAAGLGGGSVAAVLAYHLFAHIQVRVAAWKDPFATYSDGGYQVAQSLFAIGTGSWFGMGLFQGLPDEIPVADTDFIFAAISEEMGLILSLCLILVCVSCYVMFLNIALALRNQFYKLVALGLGTCYIFQVFLNIGGVTKFIPSTGVTLPLVSYGGSSILSTMIMFGIIQGLYILREDEEENLERKRERELRNGTKRRTTKKKKTTKEPGFEEVPKQRVR